MQVMHDSDEQHRQSMPMVTHLPLIFRSCLASKAHSWILSVLCFPTAAVGLPANCVRCCPRSILSWQACFSHTRSQDVPLGWGIIAPALLLTRIFVRARRKAL